MLRGQMMKKEVGGEDFRWRGREISRIEGLSDAVFGLEHAQTPEGSGREDHRDT